MPLAPRPPAAASLDLPDLDKSEDTDEVDVGSFELDFADDLDPIDGDDALDSFQVDIQEQTDPGSNEAASDLDVGVHNLLDALPEAPAGREGDSLPPSGGEIDWQLDAPVESDDPSTDTELGDDGLEDLPELAADDPEGEAGSELERGLLPGAPEGAIPAGPSFEAEWLLLSAACSALDGDDAEVLACGEQLMRFGAQRQSVALPGGARVTSLARSSSGGAVLSTTRGLLELSAGGGWSFLEPPEPVRGSGAAIVELASTGGAHDLWARLGSGKLLRRRAGVWERHEAGGSVLSVTSRSLQVTLLVVAHRPTLQLSGDAGVSFRELLLPEPAATVALGAAPTALADGAVLVLADAERGLCVSGDGGETFHMVTGGVNVTAVTIGRQRDQQVVFAALHREGRDVTELILVEPQTGTACRIAELSGEPEEDLEETGRTSALLFADGYLWAAGSYGLAKLKG